MSQEKITRTTCDGCGRVESITTAVAFDTPHGWVMCYLGAKVGHVCSPACGLKMLNAWFTPSPAPYRDSLPTLPERQ